MRLPLSSSLEHTAGPIDWVKRKLGLSPKQESGPESLPGGPDIPTDQAGQALHKWGQGETIRVLGSTELAGTFAVADARHRTLPQRPGGKAVFIPAGTKGVIKAVTAETVMVLLGPPFGNETAPPIGLYHLRATDLLNLTPDAIRKRWANTILE